jgi:hypothetical protein
MILRWKAASLEQILAEEDLDISMPEDLGIFDAWVEMPVTSM